MSWPGLSREQIPWYPTIDLSKCVGCGECFNFCKNGVYEWEEENNHPKVVKPYNCVVGCSACKNLCENETISFPTFEEVKKAVEKLKKK